MHDSRVLVAIAVGAALAGWVVVRSMTADEPPPEEAPIVAARDEPPPAVAEAPVARADAPPASPATPAAAESDADAIVQELDALTVALRKDKFMHNRAFPDDATLLDMPGVIAYLRAVDFWQPAFPEGGGGLR